MKLRERVEIVGIVAWALLTWPFDGVASRIEYWRWKRAHDKAGLVIRNGHSVRGKRWN